MKMICSINYLVILSHTIYKIKYILINCNDDFKVCERKAMNFLYNNKEIKASFYDLHKENFKRISNTLVPNIQRAQKVLFTVLFFNNEKKKEDIKWDSFIKNMTKLKLENTKFRIYSRIDVNKKAKVMDGVCLANHFYKNFFNHFTKNSDDKKTSGDYSISEIEYFFNRNGLCSDLVEFFNKDGIKKQIIIDNFCKSEMDYQIMHRLLQNVFVNTTIQSNFVIFCLNNDVKNDRNIMVNAIKQILYANKHFFTCACYTDIVENNFDYKIEVFKTNYTQDFSNVEFLKCAELESALNEYKISNIYHNSIDTKIMFDINVDEDELYICDKIPKNLFTREFNGLNYYILNMESNLYYNFKRFIYIKNDKQIEFKYVLHFIDKKKPTNTGILSEYICLYELMEGNYVLISTNFEKQLELFFKQIDIHINHNPYFTDLPIVINNLKGLIYIQPNMGFIRQLYINLNSLYKNIAKLFFQNQNFIKKIDILRHCPFDVSYQFDIKSFNYEPNGKAHAAFTRIDEWAPLTCFDQVKNFLITDQLVIRITYMVYGQEFLFYLSIGSENLKKNYEFDGIDFISDTQSFYNEHIKAYLATNNLVINEENKEFVENLDKIGLICFEQSDNLIHYLCMTDVKYRENYCKQVVSLYFLLYVIGPKKNYKHEISTLSKNGGKKELFIKEVLGIDYHVNSFILDKNDTKTKYFSHKEMCFMYLVSSEVLYKNVIGLYMKIYNKSIEMNMYIEFLIKFYRNLLKNYMDDIEKNDKPYKLKFWFSDVIDSQTTQDILKFLTECLKNKN